MGVGARNARKKAPRPHATGPDQPVRNLFHNTQSREEIENDLRSRRACQIVQTSDLIFFHSSEQRILVELSFWNTAELNKEAAYVDLY